MKSSNIFVNLAFEDTIYQHAQLRDCNYILIWRSSPCLVLGRHQNPWVEFNVPAAQKASVDIARRFSGGGAVYHDLGNLNLSFMTGRDQYNRRENLEFLARVLERWKLPVSLSSRDDLLLNGKFKVSGTAAKLARLNAYHHCTLLFNADLKNIRELLKPSFMNVHSKATESVPSPVANVGIPNSDDLIQSIIDEYRSWKTGQVVDLCSWCPEKQTFPEELNYETYKSSLGMLTSWDWIFGKTPPFTIFHAIHNSDVELKMNIERGTVKACHLSSDELPSVTKVCREFSSLPARSSVLTAAIDHCITRQNLCGDLNDLEEKQIFELMNMLRGFGS